MMQVMSLTHVYYTYSNNYYLRPFFSVHYLQQGRKYMARGLHVARNGILFGPRRILKIFI